MPKINDSGTASDEVWSAEKLNNSGTFLAVGAYQELPGISLWLDSTYPPELSTYTVATGAPTVPCMLFDKNTDEKVHVFFDIPKDWKTGTSIYLVIKGGGTTADAANAVFGFTYKAQAIGAATTWSDPVSPSSVNMDGTSAYYRAGSFELTSGNLSALGSVVGTLYRDTDAAGDGYGYDFRILSVTGYYQKKNN